MLSVFNSRAMLPALLISVAALAASGQAMAQGSTDAAKPTPKVNVKPAAKPAPATHPAEHPAAAKPVHTAKKGKVAPHVVVEAPLPQASPEQIDAAERIYYGTSDCEFKQKMDVAINPKYPAYVDVRFDKKEWTMKPVLSSTGALRLEDVKNTAVVIQIAQKSMLLNTVSGQRLVDECISPRQRELAAEAAASLSAKAPDSSASSVK